MNIHTTQVEELILENQVEFYPLKQHLGSHSFHNGRKHKWLLVNSCKCNSLISTTMKFLNTYQDETDASMHLGDTVQK
jgi:hypothetical protein